MVDPLDSPELREMKPRDRMGDEVAYVAHQNQWRELSVDQTAAGQSRAARTLAHPQREPNANAVRSGLAGHRLTVTHADGNPLARPVEVDALRIGVGERYDAWFEVTQPGAWLLQGLSSDPLAFEQASVVYTEGQERGDSDGESAEPRGRRLLYLRKGCGNRGKRVAGAARSRQALRIHARRRRVGEFEMDA